MNRQRLALYLGSGLVAAVLFLTWLWQPQRQVQRHTAQLLRAVERGKIERLETLVADQYADRWGHDKELLLGALRGIFGQFLFLKIENTTEVPAFDGATGRAVARIKMSGSGSPVAQLVIAKVNGLSEPFVFTWVKRSGKPWDWQLSNADHPTLEPGDSMF